MNNITTKSLAGKIALVTGGSRSLGAAIAKLLAAEERRSPSRKRPPKRRQRPGRDRSLVPFHRLEYHARGHVSVNQTATIEVGGSGADATDEADLRPRLSRMLPWPQSLATDQEIESGVAFTVHPLN